MVVLGSPMMPRNDINTAGTRYGYGRDKGFIHKKGSIGYNKTWQVAYFESRNILPWKNL